MWKKTFIICGGYLFALGTFHHTKILEFWLLNLITK